jgi:hypothetical protein
MAVSASSGNARDLMAPAQDRPGDARGRGHVRATHVVLPPCRVRDLGALAAAVTGPLAAPAMVLPFQAIRPDTNAAPLVVVVVAVPATGNRLAGAVAAGAAVWFDVWFTPPYNQLAIRSKDDVTTAGLLLVTGLAVSQLAAWGRKLQVTAGAGERLSGEDERHCRACGELAVTADGARAGRRAAGWSAGAAGVAV